MILVVLIASLLDPVSFLLALGGAYFTRRPWHVLVLGLIVALLVTIGIAALSYNSGWADWFIPRLLAAMIHAWLGYAIVGLIQQKLAKKSEAR